jgi:hypothetical protein
MRKEKQSVPVDKAANAGGSPQEADVSMQEEFERAAKESGGAASGEQTIVKSRLIIGGHMAEKQPARLTQSPALGVHMVPAMLSLVTAYGLRNKKGSDLTQAFPQVDLAEEVGIHLG